MSHSIYLQAFYKGAPKLIATHEIVECFDPFIIEKDEFGFKVKYDEFNSSFVFIDLNSSLTDAFSISRPCADKRLYNSVIKVAELGNFLASEPGFEKICLFSNDTFEHLHEDLKQMSYEVILTANDFLDRYD